MKWFYPVSPKDSLRRKRNSQSGKGAVSNGFYLNGAFVVDFHHSIIDVWTKAGDAESQWLARMDEKLKRILKDSRTIKEKLCTSEKVLR